MNIDNDYIKAIIRMTIMGYGYVAMAHIYSNFQGVPVVDFVQVFCDVAEREFMLEDGFIPFFKDTKTVDELEWKILFKASKTRWS